MANEYIDKVEVGAKIQTMYIRREIDYGGENDFCRGMREALRIIENTPSANVHLVRYGQWIWDGNKEECICSECGKGNLKYSTVFCPDCGARMDGDIE